MKETLRDRLIREEGLRLFPYPDTKGIWTIGVGHNIEADPDMFPDLEMLKVQGITKEEAYILLDKDIQNHTLSLLRTLSWVGDLDWNRKSVLIDMCFNLGIEGLLKFKNTLAAIEQGNYSLAADDMLNSLWAKQVGSRAENLATIMRLGDENT